MGVMSTAAKVNEHPTSRGADVAFLKLLPLEAWAACKQRAWTYPEVMIEMFECRKYVYRDDQRKPPQNGRH